VCERGELNGKVLTADAAKPSAEDVAIRGDRIIAVGTSAEIETLSGAKTRRIDFQGRTVREDYRRGNSNCL